jgi:hypothetical protein
MSDYFSNFAATGDPNAAQLPVWKPFAPGAENYMEFGDGSIPRTGGYHAEACDYFDTIQLNDKCGFLCRMFFATHMPAAMRKGIGVFGSH